MKKVENYTIDELFAKIEAIKAEREKTENALKRYEEVPLGVPSKLKSDIYYFLNSKNEVVYPTTIDNKLDGLDRQSAFNVFESYKSAEKHAEMLREWRRDGLLANAKGEPIDIQVLLPLLKKGWVAMDESGFWYWHKNKPSKREEDWRAKDDIAGDLVAFNLKPAENWETSLMECGI